MPLTATRPRLTPTGLSMQRRAPLPSRLLGFSSCEASLCWPIPLVPSCLSILFCSMPGVWVLLLGSRSPIRHYYRHRAPCGVLVFTKHTRASTKTPRVPDFSKNKAKINKKLRCTPIEKNIHHHAHHRNSDKMDDTDRAEAEERKRERDKKSEANPILEQR